MRRPFGQDQRIVVIPISELKQGLDTVRFSPAEEKNTAFLCGVKTKCSIDDSDESINSVSKIRISGAQIYVGETSSIIEHSLSPRLFLQAEQKRCFL